MGAAAAQLQTLVREQWKFVGDEVQMAAQLCGLPRVQLAPASAPLTSMSTTMSTMSTMSTTSGSETKDRRRYGFTAAPPVGSANARACARVRRHTSLDLALATTESS